MSTATEAPPEEQLADVVARLLATTLSGTTAEGNAIRTTVGGIEFTLTVTRGEPDPLAHVKVDSYITTEQRMPKAVASGSGTGRSNQCRRESTSPSGWVCTREKDHPGQHIATSSGTVYDVWPNETAGGGSDKKPDLDAVKPGDRLTARDLGDRHDCPSYNGVSWYCNRERGHPGQHIATGSECVLDTWGGSEDDPIDFLRNVDNGDVDPTKGYDRTYLTPCDYDIRGDACTRGSGHIGQHIGGRRGEVNDTEERDD